MKKVTMIIIALACILVLSLGAAFAGGQIAHNNGIGEEAARKFAYVDAGIDPADAVVKKTEFDFEKGKFIYDIEFTANNVKYEYDIDSSNGKVLNKETKVLQGAQTAVPATKKAAASKAEADTNKKQKTDTKAATRNATTQANGQTISVDKAKNIALANAGLKAKDVTFSKAKLEKDDGRQVYDIEFYIPGQNEYEYEIDALTGTILDASTEVWEAYDD